ncbi:hypothetical protein PL246_09755 [Salmonella enterica]|uniref:hypothetical protein n=1 Tax=Salmonella enterica TaxID=28901 RepID=UPI0012E5F9B8|nr:hypothetical protein [Salmonella enterica]EBS6311375.1 hypothetical protein [Salmonella enterica subsp. enterica serovar Millesi]EBW7631693.1 hypothetical protein [Salmonella enterica subsp. enterica serovar Millesi]ECA5751854.1 hypothetical protein [Salmonella enterica subsp. enterica serovar Millesi]ECA9832724.1 hypothetical protein [Salmonella enterica subsp. enterica serovar Millesi]MBH0365759.1 hypothetical protein [Salmonella enterica]
MRKLMGDYLTYIRQVESRNGKLITFKCPDCNQDIKTLATPAGEVWDTISTCPHCEQSFVKITKGNTVETVNL